MASLFVIQGADQGKRYELDARPTGLGRDGSNAIRLHDHEVSRRHAELRPIAGGYRVVDLKSANGTFVNDRQVDQSPLRSGDRVRLGQTVILFDAAAVEGAREVAARVNLLGPKSPDDRSAILRSLPADESSGGDPEATGSAGEWLKDRLASLAVMYRATQAINLVVDTDALLPQILQLVFDSIGADRGAILLKEGGELVPKAVRWRGEADPDERMSISRTIVEHVLSEGQGVITSDAPADTRFGPSQSIVDYSIREALCVPIQGRHTTLGVLYVDARAPIDLTSSAEARRFSPDHLKLMIALGHQAGLAIENTTLYQAKLQAERLAAVGQTIATLSHHIKNILQGLRGGGYLIQTGLDGKDDGVVRKGWAIVEKNQGKVYNLVMDMLSYSKDREPALEPADLNEAVADVVELMQARAEELGVALEFQPQGGMPPILIDPDGIHRAVLNIVTNAIDAAESVEGGRVAVATSFDEEFAVARVSVEDNGVGIPPGESESIFRVFASTKGSRGTGLGLPVSQKIVREHGGKIRVDSAPGRGSTFVVELPLRRPEIKDSDSFPTMD